MSIININNIYSIIEEFIEEKSITKETILQGITEALQFIYENKFPNNIILVEYNKKKEEITIKKKYTVVEKVEDDFTEMNIKRALQIEKNIQLNQEIGILCNESLNRIDILKIKQIINNKIKAIEIQVISKEFEDKKDTIVTGAVHKIDHYGTIILVHGYNAYLPKKNQLPDEKFYVNQSIKVLIKDINHEARNFEEIIVLDRASSLFVEKLLELEIPEIFEKIITIEKAVRVAGYKSKLLLSSKDKNINPIGTCIGVSGSRIKPILKEIEPERIDFINKTENTEQLVIECLKPAKINFVEIKNGKAFVFIDQEEKSAAIGKNGRNILLASQLSELEIELVDNKITNNFDQDNKFDDNISDNNDKNIFND